VLDPVRDALATAADFLPITLSVALSLAPSLIGAYCTVTLHDFCGPRLAAVHVSAVVENADAPVSDTVSAPVAAPPELVSVNVCDAVVPESIGP
jgi:hypothetical protein